MRKKALFTSLLVFYLLTAVCARAADADRIEAPRSLSAEHKTDGNGKPFILLTFIVPDSVTLFAEKASDTGSDLYYEVEYSLDGGDWESAGAVHFSEGEQIAVTDREKILNIKNSLYSFRVRFRYSAQDGSAEPSYSFYSNMVHVGDRAILGTYRNASPWAVRELDRALEYGFITDKIRNEMNAPITREEICEVILAFYESIAGEAPVSVSDAFSDTKNPEVSKAYGLGIVTGVGGTRFEPGTITNREQVATMIFRAIRALRLEAEHSPEEVEEFTDEKEISVWALEPVKFLCRYGLLKGGSGKLDPKGITTREQAVLIAVRAYERLALKGNASDVGSSDR